MADRKEGGLRSVLVTATVFCALYAIMFVSPLIGVDVFDHVAAWFGLFLIAFGAIPIIACFVTLARFEGDRSTKPFKRAQLATWTMLFLLIGFFFLPGIG